MRIGAVDPNADMTRFPVELYDLAKYGTTAPSAPGGVTEVTTTATRLPNLKLIALLLGIATLLVRHSKRKRRR